MTNQRKFWLTIIAFAWLGGAYYTGPEAIKVECIKTVLFVYGLGSGMILGERFAGPITALFQGKQK